MISRDTIRSWLYCAVTLLTAPFFVFAALAQTSGVPTGNILTGNAVTGGINLGDSGSATRFLSATAVGANANVVVVPTNLTGSANTGVPASDTVLVAAVTGFAGGASLNITVVFGYF